MKAQKRSSMPTSSAQPPLSSDSPVSSSPPKSSWNHLRSLLVVSSGPVPGGDRGSLKSPWSRRKNKHALSRRYWQSLFTLDGRFHDGGFKFLKKVRSGGVDPSIRAEVWPFLLGVYDLSSSEAERTSIRTRKKKVYEKLRRKCQEILNCSGKTHSLKVIDEAENEGNPRFSEVPKAHEYKDDEIGNPPFSSKGNSFDSKTNKLLCDGLSSSNLYLEEEDERWDIHHAVDVHLSSSNTCNAEGQLEYKNVATLVELSALGTESSDSDSSVGDEPETLTESLIVEGGMEADPNHLRTPPLHEDTSRCDRTCEDFKTWQRIIHLDAIRANSEWVLYSPSQAAVSEEKALGSATSVGLKNYDDLAPCMIYHAARLVAILEAYAVYDPETGYCQGMSDLLSPILSVMEEDYQAFWCFVGFMKKARHNFRLDEAGIRRQLNIVSKIIKCKDLHLYKHLQHLQAEDCFFVYRMVVVLFRRELTFEQTLCLWEVTWADQAAIRAGVAKSAWGRIRLRAPPTDDLLLYAIASSVLQRRKLIIERDSSMDDIVRECNSMAGQLDVWRLLDDAHDLVMSLHEKI